MYNITKQSQILLVLKCITYITNITFSTKIRFQLVVKAFWLREKSLKHFNKHQ